MAKNLILAISFGFKLNSNLNPNSNPKEKMSQKLTLVVTLTLFPLTRLFMVYQLIWLIKQMFFSF